MADDEITQPFSVRPRVHVAKGGLPEVVRLAVLVQEPSHLVFVPQIEGREFQGDHEIDLFPIDLGQIHHSARDHAFGQSRRRIPLEWDRYDVSDVPAGFECLLEGRGEQFRSSAEEGHLHGCDGHLHKMAPVALPISSRKDSAINR